MAKEKNTKAKPKNDPPPIPADMNDEEEEATHDDRGSDNGETAKRTTDKPDNDQKAEGKQKSSRALKTQEEKEAQETRDLAAKEAVSHFLRVYTTQ